MDVRGPKLGLPRVAALPGSPTQGDAVVLTTDGLLYVYDGTAWVAGGVTSRELGGVLSTDLADYYESASPLCPGANDFIVVTLAVPVTTRNGAKHEPLVGCYSTSPLDGWWIAWDYTQLSAAVGQGASHYPAAIPTANWDSQRKLGQLHAIGLRAYGGGLGSTLQIELWVGPAVHATATGSADVDVDPGATNPLRIMAGTYYGDESAANAIFAGLGYYEGTVTTAQMRRIMGRALAQAEIPEDLLAWDYVLQGRDGQTAPTTWSPSVGAGNLTKNGGPAATTGLFPPGASASTPVVLPGGGSGLSDYETRRRILLLG